MLRVLHIKSKEMKIYRFLKENKNDNNKNEPIFTKCQNCRGTDNIKVIKLSNERTSQSVVLCENCRAALAFKLSKSISEMN